MNLQPYNSGFDSRGTIPTDKSGITPAALLLNTELRSFQGG